MSRFYKTRRQGVDNTPLPVFLSAAVDWADKRLVVPHAGETIERSVDEINAKRQNMKTGRERWEGD
jgi:hypothetical protein